jgi:hypothetical protein
MRSRSAVGFGLGLAFVGAAQAQQTITVDFEDLTLGTMFAKHTDFVSNGVTLSGEEYIVFPGGPASFFGWIVVDDRNMAGGTGLEVRTDSAPLSVNAPLPLSGLSMKFGHFGQEYVNFNLNGAFLVIPTLEDVNGQTVGGVEVDVVFNGRPGNSSGELTLSGPIQSVQIGGGGTFWIDDLVIDTVCYADCDTSGSLDVFDFLCFQDAFVSGQAYADCDGNSVFDVFDFLCFQDAFVAGCP